MDLIPLLVGLITADEEDKKAKTRTRSEAIDELIESFVEYDEEQEEKEH